MTRLFLLFITIALSLTCIAGAKKNLNLRSKIGQMLLVGFEGKQINAESNIVKIIEKDNIGGVILFDYNQKTKTFDKNIESPAQVTQLNHELQTATHQANIKHHRPDVPLLISIDYEGGLVTRLSERYGFPATLSAARVGKEGLETAETNAGIMTSTLKENGFNLNFAPVLDVNVNPENPVIGKKERSFSSDPKKVTQNAAVYSEQFLKQKIQCVYKHFPGHGSSTADSHLGFVDVTDTWNSYELEPYQDLLSKDRFCGVIMTAHIVNRQLEDSGLPATLSHKIITDLLRKKLGFKGVIISDDMQMKAITDNFGLEQALVLAINAGVDMFIFGNNLFDKNQDPKEVIDLIEAKVYSGEISKKRIDEAYKHIMTLKQSLLH